MFPQLVEDRIGHEFRVALASACCIEKVQHCADSGGNQLIGNCLVAQETVHNATSDDARDRGQRGRCRVGLQRSGYRCSDLVSDIFRYGADGVADVGRESWVRQCILNI